MSVKRIFILLFLSIQVFGVILSRFLPERLFCWAPHDQQTYYFLNVWQGTRKLSGAEVLKRYGMPYSGWNSHASANLNNLVVLRESRSQDSLPIEVLLLTRTNGKNWQRWWYKTDGHAKFSPK
ncbi:MAG TPA: hypothetical protein PKD37_04775 [Oligoflexia bacterium]|nr:hypothetical protein [Oligoflexia bacterium]HMP27279.1 hypothetical protein [Oligoflexia bacterium]